MKAQYRREVCFNSLTPSQTGSSAFLLPPPNLFKAAWIYGPTTGILPANDPMVAKKSPKRTKMPYNSTIKPVKGHLTKIRIMPAENAAVPLIFSFRAKNTNVFCRPMIKVRPITNSIYHILASF